MRPLMITEGVKGNPVAVLPLPLKNNKKVFLTQGNACMLVDELVLGRRGTQWAVNDCLQTRNTTVNFLFHTSLHSNYFSG